MKLDEATMLAIQGKLTESKKVENEAKQEYYYEIHFDYTEETGKDSDGYSIFFKSDKDVDDWEEIINLADDEGQLTEDDKVDIDFVDYAQQIDKDEYNDATGKGIKEAKEIKKEDLDYIDDEDDDVAKLTSKVFKDLMDNADMGDWFDEFQGHEEEVYNEIYRAIDTGNEEDINNIAEKIYDQSLIKQMREYINYRTDENLTKTKKILNEDTISNISWEDIEDYSEDEIEEITDILNNLKPEVVNKEEHSVAVKDTNSNRVFWLDFTKEGQDIVGDWNQYIFSLTDREDRIRKAIQSSYYTDTGDTVAFEPMESLAFDYLVSEGDVISTDNGYEFAEDYNDQIDLNESKKITEASTDVNEMYDKYKKAYNKELDLKNVPCVIARDKMLSGWGGAEGRTHYQVVLCADSTESANIAYNMNSKAKQEQLANIRTSIGVRLPRNASVAYCVGRYAKAWNMGDSWYERYDKPNND